jgi:nitroreductase
MNALETIRTRRSVREYTDRTVPGEAVRELLAAAMSAPSAANEQPWHFIVIDDPRIISHLPAISPYADRPSCAPVAILVCADLHLRRTPDFWVQGCAAATENLLLAAHAMGLGAVWTGVYPIDDRMLGYRNLFSIPDHVVPFALVTIGHPASQSPPGDRYREDRVHHNRW